MTTNLTEAEAEDVRMLRVGFAPTTAARERLLAIIDRLDAALGNESVLRKELGELVETTLAESKVATGAPLYDAGYSDCARGFADAVEALLAKGWGK
jgi:hypothetical protein